MLMSMNLFLTRIAMIMSSVFTVGIERNSNYWLVWVVLPSYFYLNYWNKKIIIKKTKKGKTYFIGLC